MRRHGWERPWNVLQIIGIVVFLALVLLFYIFLGIFLGNRTLKTTILTLFSALVASVVLLHSRCSSIDPMDKISAKTSGGKQPDKYSRTKAVAQLYKVVAKKIKKFEKKILQSCIKRSYTDPWKTAAELETWMPPSVPKSDVNTPSKISGVEIALCIYCNKHMKKTSKHCRQCDKCVDGFDHHCKWLNTCIGRKNYTTFMLLLSSLLLMLVLEGSTGIFVFIRCFASKRDMSNDLRSVFGYKFPTVLLAVIAAAVVAMTAYCTAALGQLYLFHIVLIKKGIRTYDYLLAMREEYDPEELDEESDGYSSASASPASIHEEPAEIKSPSRVSKLISKVGSLIKESQTERSLDHRRLSFEHDLESGVAQTSSKQQQEQPQSKANIDPCKLIKLKTAAILKGAEKARAKSSALKNPQQQQSLAEEGPQKKLSPTVKVSNIRNGNHNNSNVNVLKPLSPEKKLGPSLRDSYVAPVADGDMEAIPLLVRNATKRKPKLIHRQDLEVDISWSEPPFPLNSISSPKLPSSKPKKKQSSKSSVHLLSKENFNPNVPRILNTTNNNEQKKQDRSRN